MAGEATAADSPPSAGRGCQGAVRATRCAGPHSASGSGRTTSPAHAPTGVFFDLAVLAAAPARMMRAGLGDTVCRTTAQVDWLLSHLLLDTAYA